VTPPSLREGQTIGVLLPSALTESFEIVLARIADLEFQGAQVKVISCNGTVKGCVSNPLRYEGTCRQCRRVRDKALGQTAPRAELLLLDTSYPGPFPILTPDESAELEAGVNSTILTFYRGDIESSLNQPLRRWIYRQLANRYREHSLFVYVAISRLLVKGHLDRLEFFNGRIVPTRGALLAARRVGCDFSVLEVSGRDRHLTVTANSSVHDIDFKQEELRRFLLQPDLDRQSGIDFFESRRKGVETNDKSFTTHQKQGKLQRTNRPVLAIFTSSADELKISGAQWFTRASQNPVEFIVELAERIGREFDVVVRMHPNQAGDKTGAASAMIETLSAIPYIQLIPPTSSVSTYELLDLACAVLTFGSTVGLEATYWGKPSILVGRALWDRQDVAYKLETPDEVVILLLTQPPARPIEAAISVGAYYIIGTGVPGSLAWRYKGITGFSVNEQSYIDIKRDAMAYWLTRAVDLFLKKY